MTYIHSRREFVWYMYRIVHIYVLDGGTVMSEETEESEGRRKDKEKTRKEEEEPHRNLLFLS